MTKTIPEIDDEMVERAFYAYHNIGRSTLSDPYGKMRAALTAALTPEPEIEVTAEMMLDGWEAYTACKGTHKDSLIASYRAMESRRLANAKRLGWIQAACVEKGDGKFEISGSYAQEAAPKGAKPAPQGVSAGAPEKATGGGVKVANERRGIQYCRRSTDPK
jgi:hypothetical protein